MARVSATATALAGLFFGAALGIAGGTFLLAPATGSQSATDVATVTAERDTVNDQLREANTVINRVGDAAVKDSLSIQSVTVLVAPGTDGESIAELERLLNVAGATTVTRVELTEKFLTQSEAETLKNLAVTTLPAGAQLSVDNREPGMHVGQLMAAAFAESTSETDRQLVFDALSGGGYLTSTAPIPSAGAVVVVLDDAMDAFARIQYAQLGRGLTDGGMRTVVTAVGPVATSDEAQSPFSGATTVDYVDQPGGRIQVILQVGANNE